MDKQTKELSSERDESGQWVLIEEPASKKEHKPVYFKCTTDIGPCSTPNLSEAAKFESRQEAVMSPAYVHPFSCYEPRPLETGNSQSGSTWIDSLVGLFDDSPLNDETFPIESPKLKSLWEVESERREAYEVYCEGRINDLWLLNYSDWQDMQALVNQSQKPSAA